MGDNRLQAKGKQGAAHFDLAAVLQRAVARHRAGRLQEAELLYRRICKAEPRHPDANHNLGLIALHGNRLEDALRYLLTAVEANPEQGQYWLSYLEALLRAERHEQARQVLAAAVQRGLRGPAVERLAQRLPAGPPGRPGPSPELASAIREYQAGNLPAARGLFAQIVSRDQRNVTALWYLGLLAQRSGELEQAIALLQQCLTVDPGFASGHNSLGLFYYQQGRWALAAACFEKALAIEPDFAESLNNLGLVLYQQGQHDGAHRNFARAITLAPGFAEAHYNLGQLHLDRHLYSLAVKSYREALSRRPDFVKAATNLGVALRHLGRLDEAEESFRRALQLDPDADVARFNLLFSLAVNPRHSPGEALAEARRYGARLSARARPYSAWPALRHRPQLLRVGLVSGDLRRHPVGYFLEGVLANWGGKQMELVAYGTRTGEDELTARLKPRFTLWRSLVGLSDAAAARCIYEDGINILIDLAGYTEHGRMPVFAWKPAPVQVSWLGYFASTGMNEVDYFLADTVGVPDEDRLQFSEQVWYLPETRLCFTPPAGDLPVAPLPALARGHLTFGCFQDLGKLTDQVLAAWGRVLAALPGAVLRLQNNGFCDDEVRDAFRQRMVRQGGDPSRVVMCASVAREAYFASYGEVDLMLDTFPYPGGTTTCEALWMGVPTLTLAGKTMLARQGASLMTAAGLAAWVAADVNEYVAKAVALAQNPEQLATLREGLREQLKSAPLLDAPRFAGNLQAALAAIWQRWLAAPPSPAG